jgi:MoaA/NifB/PqqE/SkfB family radical SAM enzyme
MLRFPLRITADITKARLARIFHHVRGDSPVQFVDAAELLHHDSNHPVSHEKIREIISSRSPIVWIGGSEPLRHPGVAHLVRAIAGSGHFVFLETDGTLLRRRIHEFQPVPRLFLAVRLDPGAQLHASKGLRPNASELAAEGIRAAQLSGFLICVHARIQAETQLRAIAELIQVSRSLDVDGIVITPANATANSTIPDAAALHRKTTEARKLIGSKWWELFSRLVEPVLSGDRHGARSVHNTGVSVEQETRANEEGVKVA